MGHHDQELLPAVASRDVLGAQHRAQRRGEDAQGPVPGLVAEGVVDGLEVVEIGEDDRERAPAALELTHPLVGGTPVQQPGESVGAGLELAPLEGAQCADPVARLLRQVAQTVGGRGVDVLGPLADHVQHAESLAEKRDRRADRAADVRAAPAQHGA